MAPRGVRKIISPCSKALMVFIVLAMMEIIHWFPSRPSGGIALMLITAIGLGMQVYLRIIMSLHICIVLIFLPMHPLVISNIQLMLMWIVPILFLKLL